LRAIAVLPVVLYHFQIGPFTGGFVGVDIFFVISGYLITSLIHSEMTNGTFSLMGFYERRARRILPALFLMLFVTTAAAGFILFPHDLMVYSRSLIATAVSGANLYFWSTVDYFDIAAERKPLLHMWSLAVEEQFYLLYPLLFYALRKASQRRLIYIVCAIFVFSLGASIWAVRLAPVSDFYLLPFRAWELALGALLALSPSLKNTGRTRAAIAWSGVALILFAFFAFSVETPFPGEYALVPCIGAACLIYAGPQTVLGRMLSLRPVVSIGLISYSLYLWHWPLLVFARYFVLRDLFIWEKTALILLSVVIATVSWAYVEKPFRAQGKIQSRFLIPMATVAIGIFAVASGTGEFSRGFPQRFDPAVRSLLETTERLPDRCDPSRTVGSHRLCRVGAQGIEPPTFVVWGDSHSESVSPAFMDIMQGEMLSGYAARRGRCAPLVNVIMASGETGRTCRDFNDMILKVATEENIRTVVLAAKWADYAEGTNFSADDGSTPLFLKDDLSDNSDRRQNVVVFSRGLERTVAALAHANKSIIFVASVPEIKFSVPYALARRQMLNLNTDIRLKSFEYHQRQINVLTELGRLQRLYGAKIVYPHQVLCAEDYCEVMGDGKVYYRDSNHLTEFGARLLSPLFEGILQSTPTTRRP
jgi:peptidoglycan/LPS O-acetylase OafA/YrhL